MRFRFFSSAISGSTSTNRPTPKRANCSATKLPVPENMSFRIQSEETVALVGLNGSGKSTIRLLATGLYKPDAGTILVGGSDTQEISLRSLRATISLVLQDPVLFDETIRGNLLYGNPQATSSDLDDVAALTRLDRVLLRLPKGYDEPLGPLGARFSGGEKKRLALARALLQQPRILIVDEITSSLDAPSAAALLRGLECFRQFPDSGRSFPSPIDDPLGRSNPGG
jgi:ATP-binding cassette subfamily B protein